MSTKNLLNHHDGTTAARRRATAVNEMRRLSRMYQPGSAAHFRVESLIQELRGVIKDPRFTGEQKDAKFKALLNRAR